PLGLSDVFRTEVLEDDARNTDLAADALGEKRLPCAYGSTEEVTHRQGVEGATLEELRILAKPALRRIMPANGVEVPLRLDELEQAAALALEQALLERAENTGIETSPRFLSRLNQDIEIGARDAGRELGQLRGIVVRDVFQRRAAAGLDERLPFADLGE